jgi:hypothetical protein
MQGKTQRVFRVGESASFDIVHTPHEINILAFQSYAKIERVFKEFDKHLRFA